MSPSHFLSLPLWQRGLAALLALVFLQPLLAAPDASAQTGRAGDPVRLEGVAPTLQPVVDEALRDACRVLREFAGRCDFDASLELALGACVRAEELRQLWLVSDLRWFPSLLVRPRVRLAGALGAYDASTDTILLSLELVRDGTRDALLEVLLEELGHAVDARLHSTDAPGDEGALFAAQVLRRPLDPCEIALLKAEDDHAWIDVDGHARSVEMAVSAVLNGNTLQIDLDADDDAVSVRLNSTDLEVFDGTMVQLTTPAANVASLDVNGDGGANQTVTLQNNVTLTGFLSVGQVRGVSVEGNYFAVASIVISVNNDTASGTGITVTGILNCAGSIQLSDFAATGGSITHQGTILNSGTFATIVLRADMLDLQGSVISLGSSSLVQIRANATGVSVEIGGADAAGVLGLTAAELGFVQTPQLNILAAANIDLLVPFDVTSIQALTLDASNDGSVTQIAGATITVPSLGILALNTTSLIEENAVTTLSATVSGTTQDFSFRDIDSLALNSISSTNDLDISVGVHLSQNAATTLTAGASGTVTLGFGSTGADSVASLAGSFAGTANPVALVGGAGSDMLTMDFDTASLPVADLSYDGGSGTNSLELLNGSLSAVLFSFETLSGGSVTIDGRTLGYTNVTSLSDGLGTSDLSFTFNTGGTITIDDSGGNADGISSIGSNLSAGATFIQPTGSITISGGVADDIFDLDGLDGLFATALTIHGNAGDDTLDVDAAAFAQLGTGLSFVGGSNTATGDRLSLSGGSVGSLTYTSTGIGQGSVESSTAIINFSGLE